MANTKIPPELVDDQVIGRKNIIINGDMRVYQRNSSTTTSNTFVVDRFKTDYLGGTLTTTRESLSSSDTPYTHGFRNSVKLTNTSAGSTAASDFRRLGQTIEAQDLANSGWNYTSATSFITLSFWVKSSLAGTYSGDLYNEDGNQGYHFDFTLLANTWTKVTHSIKGGSGVVINNDNGNGMMVRVMPYLGTNYTTSGATAETWATYSSSYITGDYAQNWASTASATFEVTGVQLEVGDTATTFEHRSFGEELNLCKRYYQQISSLYGHPCWCWATNTCGTTMPLDVEMRTNPTGTYSGGFGNLQSATNELGIYRTSFVTVNSMTIASDAPSSNPRLIRLTFALANSSVATNDAVGLYMGVDAIIKLDAEL